ncbi:hypothetical protein [Pacificispira sp.]|uniref:hypothetical protein n=1 Tax=Pacificispira sp. TaxID=2888761 RepID=UPI003B5228B4
MSDGRDPVHKLFLLLVLAHDFSVVASFSQAMEIFHSQSHIAQFAICVFLVSMLSDLGRGAIGIRNAMKKAIQWAKDIVRKN